jgi:hypothetical protein
MQEILFDYKLNPTTWAYISALMLVGTYFKFRRFWSVRNLDLIGLIAFSPALLLIYYGLLKQPQSPDDGMKLIHAGYVWLFAVSMFFMVRLLLDPLMVRRPLLEPNLSASGLAFTGVSLLIFLMANVITRPSERLERMLVQQEATSTPDPGYPLFHTFVGYSMQTVPAAEQATPEAYREATVHAATTRSVAIFAHLGIVIGMVWIGFRHFGNFQTGIAAATLYLLTFYTSQLTSQVDHVVPGMLMVWAVAAYRRPLLAGVLLGLAIGITFYPIFLLPLWVAFYWRRGVIRFVIGVGLVLAAMVGSLALMSSSVGVFWAQFKQMFAIGNLVQLQRSGFWEFYESAYRIPVFAAFVAMCFGLAIWPAQKNLGTLLSCSAAVLLGAQFWHPIGGGLHMAWYLPLLILTIFRPNLEDRVAFTAVQPIWRRKVKTAASEGAA